MPLTRKPTIGDLRSEVTILNPKGDKDKFGGKSHDFVAGETVAAAIETLQTRDSHDETFTGDQPQAQASVRIIMRYFNGLTTRHVLQNGSRRFQVYNIDDFENGHVWLVVYCHEFRFQP